MSWGRFFKNNRPISMGDNNQEREGQLSSTPMTRPEEDTGNQVATGFKIPGGRVCNETAFPLVQDIRTLAFGPVGTSGM